MDKVVYLTMLYDLYGELLTDKQKEFFELYHLDDHSLYEISVEFGISRQAVLNSVHRTEKLLLEYENKLHLLEKYRASKIAISEAIGNLKNISCACNSRNELDEIILSLNKLLE